MNQVLISYIDNLNKNDPNNLFKDLIIQQVIKTIVNNCATKDIFKNKFTITKSSNLPLEHKYFLYLPDNEDEIATLFDIVFKEFTNNLAIQKAGITIIDGRKTHLLPDNDTIVITILK